MSKQIFISIETTIFPHPGDVLHTKNPTYWKSVFIGVTFPLIHLPQIIWFTLLMPILRAFLHFGYATVGMLIVGLAGNLVGMSKQEVIAETETDINSET